MKLKTTSLELHKKKQKSARGASGDVAKLPAPTAAETAALSSSSAEAKLVVPISMRAPRCGVVPVAGAPEACFFGEG